MCTEQKARWLVHDLQLKPPPDYKLRTLCDYPGPDCIPDHTGLSEALATGELARGLAKLQRVASATAAVFS